MKLTKFLVQDYRSIQNSGWVDIDDIAVIVGKNESGKTSLLKALWKLNPFHDVNYNIDREFPTGRRKEKSLDKTVVTARFVLSVEEKAKLEEIHESAKGVTEIEVKRNYKGTRFYTFLPVSPSNAERDIPWVVSQIDEHLLEPPAEFSDHFKNQYRPFFKALRDEIINGGGSKRAIEVCQATRDQIPGFSYPNNGHHYHRQDQNALQQFSGVIDEVKKVIERTPLRECVDAVHGWLPTFVYMDDYRIFSGAAQLDEILNRKKKDDLKSEDETVMLIMEMAGLDLQEEVEKGSQEDKEQRILDMHDASQTLTNLIAKERENYFVGRLPGAALTLFADSGLLSFAS